MVLSAQTESLIYKLHNLSPNHFLRLTGIYWAPRHCQMGDRRVALAQQSFMFYLKALKMFPLSPAGRSPLGVRLMGADPV